MRVWLIALALAGCAGSTARDALDGGLDAGTGGPCLADSQCAMGSYCRLAISACPGSTRSVTLDGGSCQPYRAPCDAAQPQPCAPSESCQGGTCHPITDYCTIVPPQCPAGCTWQSPNPCACVCAACP